jgi:hypothetical protein
VNDQLAAALRAWIEVQAPNVRAAVNLLIEQAHWLDNDQFIVSCVHWADDFEFAWIDWPAASTFVESRPPCSAGQWIMLRIVVDLGTDRYEFHRLDGRNVERVIRAFTQAAQR